MLTAEYDFLGYDDSVPWPGSAADLDRDLMTLHDACRPLSERDRLKLLARLWSLTKRASGDTAEMAMTLRAYVEELAAYPGEAVEKALREWPRGSKWWPALAELVDALDWQARRIAEMYQALYAVGLREKPGEGRR